jgi:hypothetical protein
VSVRFVEKAEAQSKRFRAGTAGSILILKRIVFSVSSFSLSTILNFKGKV